MGLGGEVREEDETGGEGAVVHDFIAEGSKGGQMGVGIR